jgi:hypothetical protein
MEKILNSAVHSLKAPFRKGIFIGVLDLLFRVFALALWLLTVKLLFSFIYDALFIEIIWANKLWWLAYSAMMLVMSTILAYVAIWDRN